MLASFQLFILERLLCQRLLSSVGSSMQPPTQNPFEPYRNTVSNMIVRKEPILEASASVECVAGVYAVAWDRRMEGVPRSAQGPHSTQLRQAEESEARRFLAKYTRVPAVRQHTHTQPQSHMCSGYSVACLLQETPRTRCCFSCP